MKYLLPILILAAVALHAATTNAVYYASNGNSIVVTSFPYGVPVEPWTKFPGFILTEDGQTNLNTFPLGPISHTNGVLQLAFWGGVPGSTYQFLSNGVTILNHTVSWVTNTAWTRVVLPEPTNSPPYFIGFSARRGGQCDTFSNSGCALRFFPSLHPVGPLNAFQPAIASLGRDALLFF